MAGREILIKVVLQAIPTYVMSCFLLPVTLIQDMEKIVRKYWWSRHEAKSLHWLSWGMLCQSKKSGGMGFRDLERFNLALLATQTWRLVTNPYSLLARILKARYIPRESFFMPTVGDRPSTTWRSILQARGRLLTRICKRIGNRLFTSILSNFWLNSPSSGRIITRRPSHSIFANKVSNLIDWDSWSWKEDLIPILYGKWMYIAYFKSLLALQIQRTSWLGIF